MLISQMPNSLLTEIGFMILVSFVIAYIAQLIRQPIIPALIVAGLILGPIGLGLLKDAATIKEISEFGIAFLLFAIGMEINLDRLKGITPIATIGGFIQVALTFGAGYYVSILLGFTQFEAIILGLVVAFSSTMIVVKLLADSERLDTLHGRIILGVLLMQDIIVILAIAILTSSDFTNIPIIATSLAKGIALFFLAFILGKYTFPRIFNFAARSQDLLFLTSLAALFLFSSLAYVLNFSVAIGAFLAGVSLASFVFGYILMGQRKKPC